jgi:hypothetical protein
MDATIPEWVKVLVYVIDQLGFPAVGLIVVALAGWKGGKWLGTTIIAPLTAKIIEFIDGLAETTAEQNATLSTFAESQKSTAESMARLAQASVDTNNTIGQIAVMQQESIRQQQVLLDHTRAGQKFVEGLLARHGVLVQPQGATG